MRSREIMLIAFLLCICASLSLAQTPSQQKFVYLIRVPQTSHHPAAIQTGFRLHGTKGIVTALHGVIEGASFSALDEDGHVLNNLAVASVDIDHDLALLKSADLNTLPDEGITGVQISGMLAGTRVHVWGHPIGIDLYSKTVLAGDPVIKSLDKLIPPAAAQAFNTRQSPQTHINVMSLDGNLVPGDSGAPVVNSHNEVLAVADGGLLNGIPGISWAIPIYGVTWQSVVAAGPRLSQLATLDTSGLFAYVDFDQEAKARLAVNLWAYSLGKNVAWLSFHKTGTVGASQPPPPDIQAMVNNNQTEMNTAISELHFTVNSSGLDFLSATHNYQDSGAARFLADLVQLKDGDEAYRAYELGLRVEGSSWMAMDNQFGQSLLDAGVPGDFTIAALNDAAKAFGAKPVVTYTYPKESKKSWNTQMWLAIRDLDHELTNIFKDANTNGN
jgi:hypothetical protein